MHKRRAWSAHANVRKQAFLLATIASATLSLACPTSAAADQRWSAGAPADGVLGFVVRHWYTAIYETPFMDECPEGLNIGNEKMMHNHSGRRRSI